MRRHKKVIKIVQIIRQTLLESYSIEQQQHKWRMISSECKTLRGQVHRCDDARPTMGGCNGPSGWALCWDNNSTLINNYRVI